MERKSPEIGKKITKNSEKILGKIEKNSRRKGKNFFEKSKKMCFKKMKKFLGKKKFSEKSKKF